MKSAVHSEKHVLPLGIYIGIGLALLSLTALTVFVAGHNLGAWNIIVALLIAAIKGSLVVLFFMHLKYDHRIYAIVFLVAILFFVIFLTITFIDSLNRGKINPESAGYINQAIIYDSQGKPIPMEKRIKNITAGSTPTKSAEEIPFELLHGYGPIKEVVEVGPLDTAMAMAGKKIFETKCATCHRMDERYTGPPLRGVTIYRSPTFIMNQILDPQQNVTKHPDMKALFAQYYTMMTFQNVTKEDARKLVEYLRYEAQSMGQN